MTQELCQSMRHILRRLRVPHHRRHLCEREMNILTNMMLKPRLLASLWITLFYKSCVLVGVDAFARQIVHDSSLVRHGDERRA